MRFSEEESWNEPLNGTAYDRLRSGFAAGEDVDIVIETMRGHNLGRIIREGSAIQNTGIPGNIGGYTAERVIHAGAEGILYNVHKIGDIVEQGEEIAYIAGEKENRRYSVTATIPGIIRGLIRDGYPVTKGFKIADIDPRKSELSNCFTIRIKHAALRAVCLRLSAHLAVIFYHKNRKGHTLHETDKNRRCGRSGSLPRHYPDH